jgi:hypothetical protein
VRPSWLRSRRWSEFLKALIEMLFEHFDRFLEKCDESSCPEFAILHHGTFNRRPSGDAMQIYLEPVGEKTSQLGGPGAAPEVEKALSIRRSC